MSDDKAAMNTDREIWRERPNDFYADSIHVTEGNGIGLNVGGHVIVKPIREWFKLAELGDGEPSPPPTKRSCNRHNDCEQAEAELLARRPELLKINIPWGFHCHAEDCEDCFGC